MTLVSEHRSTVELILNGQSEKKFKENIFQMIKMARYRHKLPARDITNYLMIRTERDAVRSILKYTKASTCLFDIRRLPKDGDHPEMRTKICWMAHNLVNGIVRRMGIPSSLYPLVYYLASTIKQENTIKVRQYLPNVDTRVQVGSFDDLLAFERFSPLNNIQATLFKAYLRSGVKPEGLDIASLPLYGRNQTPNFMDDSVRRWIRTRDEVEQDLLRSGVEPNPGPKCLKCDEEYFISADVSGCMRCSRPLEWEYSALDAPILFEQYHRSIGCAGCGTPLGSHVHPPYDNFDLKIYFNSIRCKCCFKMVHPAKIHYYGELYLNILKKCCQIANHFRFDLQLDNTDMPEKYKLIILPLCQKLSSKFLGMREVEEGDVKEWRFRFMDVLVSISDRGLFAKSQFSDQSFPLDPSDIVVSFFNTFNDEFPIDHLTLISQSTFRGRLFYIPLEYYMTFGMITSIPHDVLMSPKIFNGLVEIDFRTDYLYNHHQLKW
jgi:hypothetical protein